MDETTLTAALEHPTASPIEVQPKLSTPDSTTEDPQVLWFEKVVVYNNNLISNVQLYTL
jgi:hypothetical protein